MGKLEIIEDEYGKIYYKKQAREPQNTPITCETCGGPVGNWNEIEDGLWARDCRCLIDKDE